MDKRALSLVCLLISSLLPAFSLAEDWIKKPHTLKPGNVVKASELNENFDALYKAANGAMAPILVSSNGETIGKFLSANIGGISFITSEGFFVTLSVQPENPRIIQAYTNDFIFTELNCQGTMLSFKGDRAVFRREGTSTIFYTFGETKDLTYPEDVQSYSRVSDGVHTCKNLIDFGALSGNFPSMTPTFVNNPSLTGVPASGTFQNVKVSSTNGADPTNNNATPATFADLAQ